MLQLKTIIFTPFLIAVQRVVLLSIRFKLKISIKQCWFGYCGFFLQTAGCTKIGKSEIQYKIVFKYSTKSCLSHSVVLSKSLIDSWIFTENNPSIAPSSERIVVEKK